MVVLATLLFAALQATQVVALGPKPASHRQPGRPLQHHHKQPKDKNKNLHTSYSENWAGAVLNPAPSATYTYVSATITVPTPSATAGSSSGAYEAASAWVGIDGASNDTTAILQTGVDFYILGGQAWVDAWYEWYPSFALDYDELLVNPGDVIVASVNVTSATKGVCMIENLTTGESATETVSAPKSTDTLAGVSAEWIVEDFQVAEDEYVDLVGFDQVIFSGCVAGDSAGGVYDVANATVYDMVQDNAVVVSAGVGGDGVIVQRV